MVFFLTKVKFFSFWPKTMDYNYMYIVRVLTEIELILCGPFTPRWKELQS